MKKALLFLVCTLLFVFSTMALIGCNEECTEHYDADENGACDNCGAVLQAPEDEKENEETNSLQLIKNGVPQFQFVKGDMGDQAAEALRKLSVRIGNRIDSGMIEIAEDDESTAQECEILIGSVSSRGEEYALDEHDLGYNGYMVKIIGNKILVQGGSESALILALSKLETKFFGLSDHIQQDIDDVAVTEDMNIYKPQSLFAIKSFLISGNEFSSYVITTNGEHETLDQAAELIQEQFYICTGIWLDTVAPDSLDESQRALRLIFSEHDSSAANGFSVDVDESGDLLIRTCSLYKLYETTSELIEAIMEKAVNGSIELREGHLYDKDVCNIYYSDFGAKGDGFTDDFAAIKAAHEFANEWGHAVHADPNATYYIGNENGTSSIIVKTDTYWHGCKFIFDDSKVSQDDYDERSTPIFHIASDYETVTYSESALPISSLEKGAENVGFAPGFKALIIVYTSHVDHYIRYGTSANISSMQQEIIMVDENGNIDHSTPVQWDYETVTQIDVIRADDKPITVSGGSRENRALIETIFNGAPISKYTYYWRNIYITRSNVTLENIEHVITNDIPESKGGTGAPYQGFTYVRNCANIIVQGMTFQRPEARRLYYDFYNIMGSYEMNAIYVHNLTYRDCDQSNFYNEDGSINSYGIMGTNYCKNLTFDHMIVSSFDAHQGAYNVIIKNSTLQYIRLIGDGIVTIKNVTVYAGQNNAIINLYTDYGSTWWGDIYIDGLNIKCDSSLNSSYSIALIGAKWYDHRFGFEASLPQNITMKNVNLYEYEYGIDDSGNRWESIVSTNEREIYIYSQSIGQSIYDYSDPETIINKYPIRNVISSTKSITVINSDVENPLNIVWMTSPTFKDTKVTVDGKEIEIV